MPRSSNRTGITGAIFSVFFSSSLSMRTMLDAKPAGFNAIFGAADRLRLLATAAETFIFASRRALASSRAAASVASATARRVSRSRRIASACSSRDSRSATARRSVSPSSNDWRIALAAFSSAASSRARSFSRSYNAHAAIAAAAVATAAGATTLGSRHEGVVVAGGTGARSGAGSFFFADAGAGTTAVSGGCFVRRFFAPAKREYTSTVWSLVARAGAGAASDARPSAPPRRRRSGRRGGGARGPGRERERGGGGEGGGGLRGRRGRRGSDIRGVSFFASPRVTARPRGSPRRAESFAPRQTRTTLHVFSPAGWFSRGGDGMIVAHLRVFARGRSGRARRDPHAARGVRGRRDRAAPGRDDAAAPGAGGATQRGSIATGDRRSARVRRHARRKQTSGNRQPSRREEVRRRGSAGRDRRGARDARGRSMREAARTSGRGGVRRGGETRARKCRARSSARKNTNTRICA